MLLSLLYRYQLCQVVPVQGKFEDLIVAEDLTNKLRLTQEEVTDNDVKTDVVDGRSVIRFGKNPEKEIDFTDAENIMLKAGLKRVSDEGKLEASQMELYRSFFAVPTEEVPN